MESCSHKAISKATDCLVIMQEFLLTVLLLVVSLSWSVEIDIKRGYHEEVGIPLGRHIKAAEEGTIKHRRSVGGESAPPYSYPYLAGLIISLRNSYLSICSASLLNHQLLVSAAHCWYDGRNQAQRYTVVLGSEMLFKGGLRIITSDVVVHPEWNTRALKNDISIIYLPGKIQFSEKIHPVALPSVADLSESFAGYWAVAAGYGRTNDKVGVRMNPLITHVILKVISHTTCRAYYSHLQPSQMCTSGQGAIGICKGDSGGPLVIKKHGEHILIGISSFVSAKGCQYGKPSGFTRITAYYDFIQSHISSNALNEIQYDFNGYDIKILDNENIL